MALPPSRTPPRFVPTLTEVVRVPDSIPVQSPGAAPSRPTVGPSPVPPAAQPSPAAARPHLPDPQAVHPGAVPVPRQAAAVPTRATALASAAVQKSPMTPAQVPPAAVAKAPPAAWPRPLPEGIEEHMVHRVMQRVDVVLDQRLREAIATVVQEQTRSVLPRLREEIESVVRHAVYEAVADELASGAPAAPKG
jgi:hypothetical protein